MKTALYIVKPGQRSDIVAKGYYDVLVHLGWKVFICNPSTKFGTEKLIKDHDVNLIFTSCRYGIRQLPIQLINKRQIHVAIEALPCNNKGLNIDGKYETADVSEVAIIQGIDSNFVHTNIVEELWDDYMDLWISNDVGLVHLPYAGNVFRALSNDYRPTFNVSFVGNLIHKQDLIDSYILPVFNRIKFLNFSMCLYGDDVLNKISIPNNGRLWGVSGLKGIYSRSLVCLNFHTQRQIETQAYINERSFMIQLCGGVQLTDTPIATRYFGENIITAKTVTQFIQLMETIVGQPHKRFDLIKKSVEDCALNHTYFNRLGVIFGGLSMDREVHSCLREGIRLGNMHVWNIEAGLNCAQRGKSNESFVTQVV